MADRNLPKFLLLCWLGVLIFATGVIAVVDVAYNQRTPWYSVVTLIAVAVLWLAVLLTQPVSPNSAAGASAGLPDKTVFVQDWILWNGLAWLAAFGVVTTMADLALTMGWIELDFHDGLDSISLGFDLAFILGAFSLKNFLVLLLFLGVIPGSLIAAAQWVALAPLADSAGRWAWYTFGGLVFGLVCFLIVNLLVYGTINTIDVACAGPLNGACFWLLIFSSLLIEVAWAISSATWLISLGFAGALAGRFQAKLILQKSHGALKWMPANAFGMALGGLFAPFGGLVYGAITSYYLRSIWFEMADAPEITIQSDPEIQPEP